MNLIEQNVVRSLCQAIMRLSDDGNRLEAVLWNIDKAREQLLILRDHQHKLDLKGIQTHIDEYFSRNSR